MPLASVDQSSSATPGRRGQVPIRPPGHCEYMVCGPSPVGLPIAMVMLRSRKVPTATQRRFRVRTGGRNRGPIRGPWSDRAGRRKSPSNLKTVRNRESVRADRQRVRTTRSHHGWPWEQAAATGCGGGRSSGADHPKRRVCPLPAPRKDERADPEGGRPFVIPPRILSQTNVPRGTARTIREFELAENRTCAFSASATHRPRTAAAALVPDSGVAMPECHGSD